MSIIQHRNLGGNIHTHHPYRWVVADQTELGSIIPEVGDELKLAYQEDSNLEYRLISVDPILWEQLLDQEAPMDGKTYVRKNGAWVELNWGTE